MDADVREVDLWATSTVLNPFLVRELKAAGASSRDVAEQLQYFDGDLTGIPEIQADIHDRYRTAY